MAEAPRRVAFVTGASFGIGNAIALALARDGFDVAVSGTKAENVANTCSQLKAVGVRAFGLALDIRVVERVREAVARVIGELGAIDVLVNNAGIPVDKMVLDIAPAEW